MAVSLKSSLYGRLRKTLLGAADLPQAHDLPLDYPQTEITVWLHGVGEPRDVTWCHSVACAAPFTFCIGFAPEKISTGFKNKRLSLRFCETTGQKRLLGEIGLELSIILPQADRQFCLFKAIDCRNRCIPRARLWAYYVFDTYTRRKNRRATDVHVSSLDTRCNAVTFICPRPIVLVSVFDGERGTIFPMNYLGTLGDRYFGFALNSKNQAGSLVKSLGRAALSSIPFGQAEVVRGLGRNHRQQSIDWTQLPFNTRKSESLNFPVPDFATRVCELEIQYAELIGSHTFFLARILGEEVLRSEPEFYRIYGLYATYKQMQNKQA